MCNACGLLCCGSDVMEQCGCEGCPEEACWERCEDCGDDIEWCHCDDEDEYPDDEEHIYG